MLNNPKACIRAALVVSLLLLLLCNVASATASSGVQVTRIINGSNDPIITPGYQAGDIFTVELDYSVTGTQYLVTIGEKLPAGWTILNSTETYRYDTATDTYQWNVTSPLNGVRDGKIWYLVQIPVSASGTNDITGWAKWFDNYDAVQSGMPTDMATTDTTHLNIVPVEFNGPNIWISQPAEATGDGDTHVEPGELAAYYFTIADSTGIDSGFIITANGNIVQPSQITWITDTDTFKEGIAYVLISQAGGTYDFSITASDHDGISSSLSLISQLPFYDYSAWYADTWNGMKAHFASMEPSSTQVHSNWIQLDGGTYYRIPDVSIYYNGPRTINYGLTLSNIPFISQTTFVGLSYLEANVTPRTYLNIPYLTKTPNGPYKTSTYYTEQGNNTVAAEFSGQSNMSSHTFHVMLVNLTKISDQIDFTSTSTIKNSIRSLTLQEVTESLMDSRDYVADDIGDIEIDYTTMPELQHMQQGYYALLVWDYNIPDVPCLDSSMPIIVTKSDMTVDLADPAPMPGDSLSFFENVPDAVPGNYRYVTALIPEANYSANIYATTSGKPDGSRVDLNGFSLIENTTLQTDGTVAGTTIFYQGMNTTMTLTKADLENAALMEQIAMGEINASDMAIAMKNSTSIHDVEVVVPTRNTMPAGKYIVLTAVIDRDTGRTVSLNQTTINLYGTYTFNLVSGWNLISLPLNVQNNDITSIFPAGVISHIVDIWGWDSSTQNYVYYSPDPSDYFYTYYPAVTKIEAGKGYWVNMDQPASFTVTGTIPDNAPNSAFSLQSKWNLVGPTGLSSISTPTMYPSVVDIWGWNPSIQNYVYYSPDPSDYFYTYYSKIDNTEIGQGYWVYMS